MKLSSILNCVAGDKLVTIENYITHEIIIDRDTAWNIIHNRNALYHTQELKNYTVYKLDIGTVHGDLIISVLKEN